MSGLAIDGGAPVRSTLLPYGHQSIDEEDERAVLEALRSDWITGGPRVSEFEDAFAATVEASHGVALASGTAALHAAMFAAGVGPGDEVVTSPLTFVATGNSALYLGGRPVFADVAPDTLNLDPAVALAACTDRTKVVAPVDFAGHPCDIDAFLGFARDRGITVIEDACHAVGAREQGRAVGGLADMTVFSFHPVKHLTTGEGGMVTTDDARLAERLRMFRNHGISSDAKTRQDAGTWFYEMVALGFNYRITDLQCALGLSQLSKVKAWHERRAFIARRYSEAFAAVEQVEVPAIRDGCEPAWHLYPIRLRLDRLCVDRARVFDALRAEGLGVNVHYIPVPWHPYYRALGYEPGGWPIAESAYERLISIPIFPAMSDDDVRDVIEAVAKVSAAYAA